MFIQEIVSEIRGPVREALIAESPERRRLADLPAAELDELVERVVEAVLRRLAQRWQE